MKKRSDNIMTVPEVAEYLTMHKITVYKLIKAGIIPAFKIGGQWRFKKSTIDSWIAKGMDKNKAESELKNERKP